MKSLVNGFYTPPPYTKNFPLWWRLFKNHLQIPLVSRTTYNFSLPLIFLFLFQLIQHALQLDDDQLLRELNIVISRFILAIISMGVALMCRSAVITVDCHEFARLSDDLHIKLTGLIFIWWALSTTATLFGHFFVSPFCLVFICVYGCLAQWRYIFRMNNIIDFVKDSNLPSYWIISYLTEGYIQTMLVLVLSAFFYGLLLLLSAIIILIIPTNLNILHTFNEFGQTLQIIITLPTVLIDHQKHTTTHFQQWFSFVYLLVSSIWITFTLELHSQSIQAAKDEMSVAVLSTLDDPISQNCDLSWENELLFANAMFGCVKNAPLRLDLQRRQYEIIKPISAQISTHKIHLNEQQHTQNIINPHTQAQIDIISLMAGRHVQTNAFLLKMLPHEKKS